MRGAGEGPQRVFTDHGPVTGPRRQTQPADGPKKNCPMAARPLKETVEGCGGELSPRPLRGLVRTPGKEAVEDPGKALSEEALGAPRTWKSHLQVPVRRQMRAAQPGAASRAADPDTREVCVLS